MLDYVFQGGFAMPEDIATMSELVYLIHIAKCPHLTACTDLDF